MISNQEWVVQFSQCIYVGPKLIKDMFRDPYRTLTELLPDTMLIPNLTL